MDAAIRTEMAQTSAECSDYRCDVGVCAIDRLDTVGGTECDNGDDYANGVYVLPQSAVVELRRCGCVPDTDGATDGLILGVIPTVLCGSDGDTAYLSESDTNTD